jgi:hypothetical protein
VADGYAADLLMPSYLFKPRTRSFSHTSFEAVDELKNEFNTSLLATALRLVDCGPEPVILTCHDSKGRNWFKASPVVAKRWFPQKQLDADSYAYDILRGQERDARKRWKMLGDTWFDFDGANDHELFEESILYDGKQVLTFITFADPYVAEI